MSAPVLPNLFQPVADRLLADALFGSLVPGRLGPGAPADVTLGPYAVLRVSVSPLSGKGVAWRATAALHGCTTGWVDDKHPDTVVWDIAAAAAAVFHRAANVVWQNLSYTARVTDGPLPMDPDTSRGEATPVYWAMVRADLTIHAR